MFSSLTTFTAYKQDNINNDVIVLHSFVGMAAKDKENKYCLLKGFQMASPEVLHKECGN